MDGNFKHSEVKISKSSGSDEDGPGVSDIIISPDYDEVDLVFCLPKFIIIRNCDDDELPFMKLRKPVVLSIHKYKKDTNPHAYYFAELKRYFPHSDYPGDVSLNKEKDDFDAC